MRIHHSYIRSRSLTVSGMIGILALCLTLSCDFRSKGLTENQLAELGYSDTIVFRPGFLANAERPGSRIMESLAAYVFHS